MELQQQNAPHRPSVCPITARHFFQERMSSGLFLGPVLRATKINLIPKILLCMEE
jgi:hypothetical protein